MNNNETMKETFEMPTIEVVTFDTSDVVDVSGGFVGQDDDF